MTVEITNLLGNDMRLFGEPHPTPDETSFQLDNTSDRYYRSPYYVKHQKDLQEVPPPRTSAPRLDLADVLPAEMIAAITAAKRISFHSVGDTGAAKVKKQTPRRQSRTRRASPTRWRVTCATAARRHPLSSSTSATSSTTSARASTTTTSSTSRSATTTGRSSRSRATTTERCSATRPTRRASRLSRRSCATSAPKRRARRPTRAASSAA